MQISPKKSIMLLDAHALIHRAYHALPEMSTRQGEPTGGLYGLLTMLFRAIADYHPDYMVACYDLPGPTFRHREYADYKGTRVKTDDALKAQLERSRDVFRALSIPIYDAPGFEADDMLGSIVEQTKEMRDVEIIIVTGDADSLQLVSGKKVRVFTLRKGLTDVVIYDEAAVKERYGFAPSLLPDYKGFCGDASDNIKGVDGIGDKTASQLVSLFGSVEEIYLALEKDEKELLSKGIKPRTITLLKEGKDSALFSKMLATIRRDAPITFSLPNTTWRECVNVSEIKKFFEDLEFRTMGKRLDTILSPSLSNEETPIKKDIEPLSEDEQLLVRKAQIAFWLLDAERGRVSPVIICEETRTKHITEAYEVLRTQLSDKKLLTLFEEIEVPLIAIVKKIEEKGIQFDKDHLLKLSKEYHIQLERLKKIIITLAGEEFNMNSPKQLGVILFEKLGLSIKGIRKTAGGGARSTKESELEKLKGTHPIIEKILEYREIQKVLTTYIDALPPLSDNSGRIHTRLHQDGTVTGRFSSTDPNLQNIPVKDGYGELIRDAFVAPRGKILMALDYSQIELRVLAMLSKDRNLTEIFEKGKDIHAGVASKMFGIPEERVTETERRRAKTINFGILYGMGVTALAQGLSVPREEAQKFHEQYFAAFPTIRDYLENVLKTAEKVGYTETLFGRRRPFPNLRSKIPFVKAMAERMAMNAPIQGTAADLVKKAMVDVDDALRKENVGDDVSMILQVHDELIFEVTDKKEIIERAEKIIRKAMESVHLMTSGAKVPLHVSIATGKRWGSLVKIR